ncbi:LytTR family DNA-binding domain-containing protein [Candidatus Enterococcus palustris]|uniref:LytR/AlgR family response regulator transcription factor n=1 Tax=Candidatus Enterococcus palustris TaxID=1834189 RepID=UPI0030CF83EC
MNFIIKVAILDDEIIFTKQIKVALDQIVFKLNLDIRTRVFHNSLDFIKDVTDNTYHILFLDISMPNIDGITLSKELVKLSPETIIIFISTQEDLVFEAFGMNVFSFIKKEELSRKLEQVFLNTLNYLKENDSLFLKTMEGNIFVKVNEIYYFSSINRKIYLHTQRECSRVNYMFLKILSKELPPLFMFINRSTIVNVKHVEIYSKDSVIISNDSKDKLYISRGRQKEVLEHILKYRSKDKNIWML